MGCFKEKVKKANTFFSYDFECKIRMSIKWLDCYKVPTQSHQCYDWFHRIPSTFTLLLISELLQHKTISEKEWIPRQQIQSGSRMFWILMIINTIDTGNWKIVDKLFVSEMHCELTQLLQPQNHKAFWCSLPCFQNHIFLPPSRKSHLNLRCLWIFFLLDMGEAYFSHLLPISLHFIWNRTQGLCLMRKSSPIPI